MTTFMSQLQCDTSFFICSSLRQVSMIPGMFLLVKYKIDLDKLCPIVYSLLFSLLGATCLKWLLLLMLCCYNSWVPEGPSELRCYGVTLCVGMIYHVNSKCYYNKSHQGILKRTWILGELSLKNSHHGMFTKRCIIALPIFNWFYYWKLQCLFPWQYHFRWDIGNSIFDLENYLTWKFKMNVMNKDKPNGDILGLEFNQYFYFVFWQLDHLWLRYSKYHIWPWKFKVKIMTKDKSDG